jgi:PAS domain-containing protein
MQPAIRRRAPRAAALPSAAGVPSWMRRLSAIALGCAALGLALLIVSLAEFVEARTARPLALVLIVFAAACGLASLVARQVHAALAGRVDLLSQALEASPNAHLVVAPDGSIAYANAAFHRFFPELGSPPIDAIARRFAEDKGAAAPPPGSACRRICWPGGRAMACGASRTSPRATRWSR